jgi:hypothetical protein
MEMKTYLLLFGVIIFFSCKKAEDRKCLKFAGDESERIVNVDIDIDTLFLYDNLYYSLIQGEEAKVVLSGGENLLSHINLDFSNGTLTITDENKCKFLRSYKNKIHAKIYVDSISYIYYEGGKELKSIDTLRSNEMRLIIRDGAGSTDLTLRNGYTSAIVTHGFGDFTLRGSTQIGFLNCNTNSFCDTRSFQVVDELIVKSNTVGKMLINANQTKLFADILQRGNIEYVGYPTSISINSFGEGQLIDLNN